MGRVYFPTQNNIGVRDLSRSVTLGYFYDGYRGPAEPAAKAAMNPVTLGAVAPTAASASLPAPMVDYVLWRGSQIPMFRSAAAPPAPAPAPVSQQSTPTPQVTAPATPPPTAVLVTSGGGTASPASASAPPPPYVDPSGNTWMYNPATGQWAMTQSASGVLQSQSAQQSAAPVATAAAPVSASVTDQVAAWLGGTTPIGSWNIPNALLAGGVVLGFALFMGGGGKKR